MREVEVAIDQVVRLDLTLQLGQISEKITVTERQALIERLQTMQIELHGIGYQGYLDLLAKQGGIVEEFISGDEFASPSVQLRTTPLGELEILSTHDQMLGGPNGQIYLGAKFPAGLSSEAPIAFSGSAAGPLDNPEKMKFRGEIALSGVRPDEVGLHVDFRRWDSSLGQLPTREC